MILPRCLKAGEHGRLIPTARRRSTTGWFFGVKLHVVINHKGQLGVSHLQRVLVNHKQTPVKYAFSSVSRNHLGGPYRQSPETAKRGRALAILSYLETL